VSLHHAAVAYLALQSAACAAWWVGLAFSPGFRAHFVVPGQADETLLVFWLPDLVVWILGSLVAAYATAVRARWAPVALGVAAGGVLYPTLHAGAVLWMTGSGALGFVLMTPAALTTAGLALLGPRLVR
jgi:hypothetical protein